MSQAELATAEQASTVLAEDTRRTTSCADGVSGPVVAAIVSLGGLTPHNTRLFLGLLLCLLGSLPLTVAEAGLPLHTIDCDVTQYLINLDST